MLYIGTQQECEDLRASELEVFKNDNRVGEIYSGMVNNSLDEQGEPVQVEKYALIWGDSTSEAFIADKQSFAGWTFESTQSFTS